MLNNLLAGNPNKKLPKGPKLAKNSSNTFALDAIPSKALVAESIGNYFTRSFV
jgi:hypothetical protein